MRDIKKAAATMGRVKSEKKAEEARKNGKLGGAPVGKQRYYYALTDGFTGDNPGEYTSGFANRKEPLAFLSPKERMSWLSSTNLLTANPISRDEALSMTEWMSDDRGRIQKRIRLYGQSPTEPWTWPVILERE